MAALEVRDLYKSYKSGFLLKSTDVLKGVNFKIEEGAITGFLGGNGAGKTTTMKCILGLTFPNRGEIKYFGASELNSAIKTRIGFLPERPYFYDYLTGVEFLEFYGELSTNFSRKVLRSRIEDLLKQVDLWAAKDRKLRGYSKGMLQKIGLAQALIHDPELVILDEPMSGLDPDGRFYMNQIIRETASRGTAVFFSSHLLHDAERLCENLVILSSGKVVFEGTTQNFLSKMDSGFEILCIKAGESVVETLGSTDEVQSRLTQLQSQGAEIVELRRKRVSLEEAFVKVALREEKSP